MRRPGQGLHSRADLRDETKRRLKVLSLTDNVGWLTAIGNDCGYDQIFVQQLMNFGQTGDLAIAISGSGNSPNVLAAVEWANRHGLKTFGMTGFDGGKLKKMQGRHPRPLGRHGHGRKHPRLPDPLGHRRPVRADQRLRTL